MSMWPFVVADAGTGAVTGSAAPLFYQYALLVFAFLSAVLPVFASFLILRMHLAMRDWQSKTNSKVEVTTAKVQEVASQVDATQKKIDATQDTVHAAIAANVGVAQAIKTNQEATLKILDALETRKS